MLAGMVELLKGATLAGVKALVVEDDADTRELIEDFLMTCGVEVRTAASGDEGFDAFVTFQPTVIISDIHMPGGDGLSFIRRVRTLPPHAGGLTPAIALSGGTTNVETLGAGFHVHIPKPFDPMFLTDVVRDFAKGNASSRSTWTLKKHGNEVVVAWVGHITKGDMQAGTAALAELLEASEPCVIVSDFRGLTGFDHSVASVAENAVWGVRKKITHVTIVGGSTLCRLVSKAGCVALGVSCSFA